MKKLERELQETEAVESQQKRAKLVNYTNLKDELLLVGYHSFVALARHVVEDEAKISPNN